MNLPVLARYFEAFGFSTILVTMMPFWSERIGTPRTLAVEFPFAQTIGSPNNIEQQLHVINHALDVLKNSTKPGKTIHYPERWQQETKDAILEWQPPNPSPIAKVLVPQARKFLRQRKDG